ncbi:MAG: hypothetical protein GY832_41760 [Chloroflexi bacterium]|nr:hypothetical protein [Chloroflexota bacterium]
MEKHFQKLPARAVVFLMGLGVTLICLVLIPMLIGPMSPAGAQDFQNLQVWPDHSIGVTSGLLGEASTHVSTEVFPLGSYHTPEDNVAYARTYLRFPLDVFPPGTEILHATLYVYVDGSSSEGEANLGVYRTLDLWEDIDTVWSSDPNDWPSLLTSPLAVAPVRIGVITPTSAISAVVPTSTPSPLPTATLAPTATSTPTTFGSPLPTPTSMPTPTPSPPIQTFPMSVVPLGQVPGTWITWDVTVLIRAWLEGEISNDGLAIASAPDPNAGAEMIDDLLVVRWLTTADPDTRPHIIAEFEVRPVTPTPPPSPLATPTSVPVLPPAGSSVGGWSVGLLFAGIMFLILGLISWKKSSAP